MAQECGIQPSGSEQGAVVESCKYSNVPSSSTKMDNFLNSQAVIGLLRKDLLH